MKRVVGTWLLMALLASQTTRAQKPVPSEDAWQWLRQIGWRAIDSLMPITGRTDALVVFRSYQDLHYEVHEQYFRIDQSYIPSVGLRLSATRVAPVGESLQQQLLALYVNSSGVPVETLLPQLHVSITDVAEASCPALRARVDKLAKLRINLPFPNVVGIHPMVRKVIINTNMGRIDATLFDGRDPTVRWALETFEALGRCGQVPREKAKR